MKSTRVMLLAIFVLVAATLFAQDRIDSFKVYGNCGMCKKRIEKAVKLEGVSAAVWNVDTKIIRISYDAAKTSNDELQKKIAAVGHDTEKYAAEDSVYAKLPGCCLYERKSPGKKDSDQH